MNYKTSIAILLLLLAIFLFPFLQKYEMFCQCGTNIKEEPFCDSGCVENFSLNSNTKNNINRIEQFCPGKYSSKKYSLNNLYTQSCGYNTPTTKDYSNGYYIHTIN
jgi:hypothetical protein